MQGEENGAWSAGLKWGICRDPAHWGRCRFEVVRGFSAASPAAGKVPKKKRREMEAGAPSVSDCLPVAASGFSTYL